jgi:hypothetical protein
MKARFLLRCVVVGVALALAAIAGAKAATTSSISLDQSGVALGDTVTFTSTVEKLKGNEWPMVALSCFQDVNLDGVVDSTVGGPDQVFGVLDTPSAVFSLGGGSSLWLDRGGAATCKAELFAYGFKGGAETVRQLATTGNWAAAG